MGRKKRRESAGSAGADVMAASPGGAAAGKRSRTQGLPAGGGAAPANAAAASPLLAPPAAADEAYEVHRPPPVGLAKWFEDAFGEEAKSPWTWSPDGVTYKREEEADGEKRGVKVDFDAAGKKLGIAISQEDADGKESASLDVMKGKVGWSRTGSDGHGTGASASVGGGELGGEWGTSLDAASGSAKTTDEARLKASVIAGKDGVGVRGGVTTRHVVDDGQTKQATANVARIGVTDKGVVLDGSSTQSWTTKDGLEAKRKVSADGAFLVEIIPPRPGEDPTRVRVVTTLRAGLDAKAQAGKSLAPGPSGADPESDANKVKVSGSADLGGSLVYSRLMSAAEAKAYLADLDSAEPSRRDAFPEYAMLEQLRTVIAGDGHETAAAAALVGAAGSARALLPGDSVSLSLHAGAAGELGVDVSGRGLGAGFDVGGGFEYIRNVTVSGVAGGKVRVSVGFEHESSSKAGASGTAMYTKLGGGIASASSDGEAREYVLDPRLPDYDACYAKILGVWTRDGLHALDADPAVLAHRTKAITSTAARDATTGAVSLVGAGVEGGASTFGASSLTVDANGVSGERSGGQSADFGLGVGDARPFRRTDTHTATASVDADGQLSADLETRSSETDLGHTIGHAKDIVGGWLGFDERDETVPSGKEVLTGVLARSPGERLAQLLSTTYTRLSGYHLSPADVTVLVARARDEERWLRCARSASAVVPMRVLRAALVAELPDPEVDVDASDAGQRARAIELAHARAIADFMKHAGGSGMEALPHVLRRWGESSTREGTGAALGVRFEWPASLDHEHERLDRVVAELRDLEATYAGLLGKPGAKDAANAIAGRIRVGLYTVREAVRSSTDIHSERARAEMLDQLSRYETVAVTAHDELLAQLDATGPLESSEAGVPASAPTAPSERPMAARLAPRRVRTLSRDLADLKVREQVLLARARGDIAVARHAAARNELAEVRELYDFWRARSEELRDASRWAPGEDRPGPTPDVETMIALWIAAGGDEYQVAAWPAIWRERWK